jgi:hypothetical protein
MTVMNSDIEKTFSVRHSTGLQRIDFGQQWSSPAAARSPVEPLEALQTAGVAGTQVRGLSLCRAAGRPVMPTDILS